MPLDPITIGAAVSAGSNILGGLFGNKSNRRAIRDQMNFQREFAQHGIRWRVEDAKAAGLHPLFAMGAQLPSASPVFSSDSFGPALSAAGQDIGRAIGAKMSSAEREQRGLELAALRANIAESDARRDLLTAQAARERQESLVTTPFPAGVSLGTTSDTAIHHGAAHMATAGFVEPGFQTAVGSEMTDRSVTPHAGPLWNRFMITPDLPIWLPGGITGDAAEALESLGESPILMGVTVLENLKRNPSFLHDLAVRYNVTEAEIYKMLGLEKESFVNFLKGVTGFDYGALGTKGPMRHLRVPFLED